MSMFGEIVAEAIIKDLEEKLKQTNQAFNEYEDIDEEKYGILRGTMYGLEYAINIAKKYY